MHAPVPRLQMLKGNDDCFSTLTTLPINGASHANSATKMPSQLRRSSFVPVVAFLRPYFYYIVLPRHRKIRISSVETSDFAS